MKVPESSASRDPTVSELLRLSCECDSVVYPNVSEMKYVTNLPYDKVVVFVKASAKN